MSKLGKWWKAAAGTAAAVVALQVAVSALVRTGRMHAYLTAHLERAFGRPVQVGSFGAHIFPRLQLYANEVTVGEDPAFGYEYFLRAEHLSAGLRWSGLLRGHFGATAARADHVAMERGFPRRCLPPCAWPGLRRPRSIHPGCHGKKRCGGGGWAG